MRPRNGGADCCADYVADHVGHGRDAVVAVHLKSFEQERHDCGCDDDRVNRLDRAIFLTILQQVAEHQKPSEIAGEVDKDRSRKGKVLEWNPADFVPVRVSDKVAEREGGNRD